MHGRSSRPHVNDTVGECLGLPSNKGVERFMERVPSTHSCLSFGYLQYWRIGKLVENQRRLRRLVEVEEIHQVACAWKRVALTKARYTEILFDELDERAKFSLLVRNIGLPGIGR